MNRGTCKHFSSLNDPTCRAGVSYSTVKLPCGAMSCLVEGSSLCAARCEPTAEEIAAFDRESDEFMAKAIERMQKLEPLIDRVKKKYRGRDLHGHATCPVCGVKSALTITHSARNGHVHAFCMTEGCVRLME